LARLAKPLASAIKALVSIAKPETVMRWIREADRNRPKKKTSTRKPGGPRTRDEIRRLVLKIAKETGRAYPRILGEFKKLKVKVSRRTVVNILREANLPTSPERAEATWDQFIKSHAKTLWACDFVEQRILTVRGFRDAYLLVFVNVATRKAIATTSTEHLPVQDRFGGLADHSRGGSMGVRSARVVNGIGGNRVFRAASGVQIFRPRPLASRGDLRAVPPGRYGRRPRSAAAPAGCGQAEKSHADDWLRPDRGVGRARIAGRARLSLKVARFCTLPPAPTPEPRRFGDAKSLPPPA